MSRAAQASPFRASCIGMVVAGGLSSVVGTVQVFAPAWPDGNWAARTYMAGRAVGTMRQPNHLSSVPPATAARSPCAASHPLRRRASPMRCGKQGQRRSSRPGPLLAAE